MKRFALPLGALAFALACTDATSPDPHAALNPRSPSLDQGTGNIPPPPVDAAIVISIESDLLIGTFTGVYFANAATVPSVLAATEVGDLDLAFNGTAWLRLDNTQTLGSTASANARFQVTHAVTDPKFFGRGTLVITDAFGVRHTVTIDAVRSFTANPDCFPGALCATIVFDASIDGESGHKGTAQAFDREVCTSVFVPDETEEGGGHYIFFCPFGDSGS